MPSKKIPEGWLDYTPVGGRIEKTRFICFKVPLKETTLANQQDIPDKDKLSPEELMKTLKQRDQQLGMVIDLTNTTKYYDPKFFIDRGIKYEKLFTEGRIVPPTGVTNKFSKFVEDFLEENKDNEKLIGVHCTHGLNRTGYMVCRHLVDKLDFTAEDAIKAFNIARGHDIERENYIDALHGRPYVDPPTQQSSRPDYNQPGAADKPSNNQWSHDQKDKWKAGPSRREKPNTHPYRSHGYSSSDRNNWRDRESHHSNQGRHHRHQDDDDYYSRFDDYSNWPEYAAFDSNTWEDIGFRHNRVDNWRMNSGVDYDHGTKNSDGKYSSNQHYDNRPHSWRPRHKGRQDCRSSNDRQSRSNLTR